MSLKASRWLLNFFHEIKAVPLPTGPAFANLPQFLSTLIFIAGFSSLIYSSVLSWFAVPSFLQQSEEGYDVILKEANSTLPYKMVCMVMLTIAGTGFLLKRFNRAHLIIFASLALAWLFYYPASVIHFSPDLAGEAGWLYQQHRNLSWLGGDIYTAQEEAFFDFRQNLYIVDPPSQSTSVSIPHSIPHLIQFGLLSKYASWLGYSEANIIFLNKGWFFALIGTSFIGLSMIRRTGDFNTEYLRSFFSTGMIATGCFGFLALIPTFIAAHNIGRAASSLDDHKYQKAYEYLDKAMSVMPVLKEESTVIIQKCLIAHLMEKSGFESKYYKALIMERDGFKSMAEEHYIEIIGSAEASPQIRREANRSLMRLAVHRTNSQQFEDAYKLLRRVMLKEPYSLKANYVLQFICLQTGRFAEVSKLDNMLSATYSGVRVLNKKAILASSRQISMLAYYLQGDTSRAHEYKRKSIKP